MGLEAKCRATFGKQVSDGKAQVEGEFVSFRGDFRVKMATATLRKVKAQAGSLRLEGPEGTLVLEVGEKAPAWADKILHPPTRLDKLGVKPGMRIVVLHIQDNDLERELRQAGTEVHANKVKDADFIFLEVRTAAELKKLEGLDKSLRPGGGIWIVYPKGVEAVTQAQVLAAIRAAKLVDVKVCAFSETHTAIKAVVPVAQRR